MGNKLEKGNENPNSNSNSNNNYPQKNPKLSNEKLRQKDGLYAQETIHENFESN
jgi:hypothetical protein